MTLQQIIFFITIYKNKSFTAAAKELGVSQSVLSKQMIALEKEMGSKLIVRNAHHMKLTPHGEVLLPHALQMAKDYREILHCAARQRAKQETITLGGVSILNTYGITEALISFEGAYPSYSIDIWETETNNVLSGMYDHSLDIGIGWFQLPMERESERLNLIPLIDDEQVLIASPALFPPGTHEISIAQLKNKYIVLQNSDPNVAAYHLQILHSDLHQDNVHLLNIKMDSLVQFILKKNCVSIMMKQVAEKVFAPQVPIFPLSHPLTLTLCIILPKHGASGSCQCLVQYLRKAFQGRSRFS
ncbi:LysR family transcriptional regulator [Lawsonibacter sp. LCP25S3_G6]|uniref:LysR family transcriptional regulator n=1 Tax=unclassified Lawsonibacter TaxID=2617946 RepID=UPI003F9D764E